MLQWDRRLVARHWTQPPSPKTGRPPIDPEVRRPIIRLVTENPDWGYRRIHGELARVGHKLAASTVWTVLSAAGIDPTRDRTGPSRAEVIRSQSKAIVATDFACVDTALLQRFHVLFVIEHATRRVHLVGITKNPTGPWTTRAARNLMMRVGEHHPFRFQIRDGAGQFTRSLGLMHGRVSRRFGFRPVRLRRTHTRNAGSAPCATNSWTRQSSGTNANSDHFSKSTSSITTHIDPTEESNNGHPMTPATSSRSAQANRSNDTPPVTGSSTNTAPQPEPPHGQ